MYVKFHSLFFNLRHCLEKTNLTLIEFETLV